MRLATRLYLILAAFTAVIFLALHLALHRELSAAARDDAARELENTARIVRGIAGSRPFDDPLADSLAAITGVRVTLIAPDGTVLGDSEVGPNRLPRVENHADRPEVIEALEGGVGIAERGSETIAQALLYVAIPAEGGVVRVARRVSAVTGPLGSVPPVLLIVALAALVLFYPLSRFLAGGIEARLAGAEAALEEIAADGSRVGNAGQGTASLESLRSAIERAAHRVGERLRDASLEARDLRALFDGLDEALAFIDAEGLLRFANPAFERAVGRSSPTGARLGSLFRAPDILEAVNRAQDGESVTREVRLGERTILMAARPHRGGALLVIRDLTNLRRLEGVRRDFVANVSHELKTPLTSVVGFAEAIVDGDAPKDAVRDFARRILANASRMRRLVDDLLELALVESGSWTPTLEPVGIADTATGAWEEILGPHPERGPPSLAIDDPDEAVVHADVNALRQILRNLLDNASRYAPAGSVVTVRVRAAGAFVRTEVIDTGPGIPSVHIPRVFERFYRVDPGRSREQGGTGLGLAIVKHFVVAHSGEVGIESEVSRGTSVWFTLPVSDEPIL